MYNTIKEIKRFQFSVELHLIPFWWFVGGGALEDYVSSKYPNMFEFISDYARSDLELSDFIDNYVGKKYGSFVYVASEDFPTIGANASDFTVSMGNYLITHADSIDRYIALSKHSYDPLTPTNREEKRTVTKEGKETTASTKGEETTTDVNGARHIETTSKVAPYDNETYYENNKTIGDNNSSTDKRTTSGRLDENEKTFEDRKDTTEIEIHANNGARTQAEILGSEQKLWNSYSIVDFIFRGFVAENCIL